MLARMLDGQPTNQAAVGWKHGQVYRELGGLVSLTGHDKLLTIELPEDMTFVIMVAS